jgi:hypothetical protein
MTSLTLYALQCSAGSACLPVVWLLLVDATA